MQRRYEDILVQDIDSNPKRVLAFLNQRTRVIDSMSPVLAQAKGLKKIYAARRNHYVSKLVGFNFQI